MQYKAVVLALILLYIEHTESTDSRRDENTSLSSFNLRDYKRYAMVLFNTTNREGAVEEAGRLLKALLRVGCDVHEAEWSTTTNLTMQIRHTIEQEINSTKYSLMFVCIMAHGISGRIVGQGETEITINDVLLQLSNLIPAHIPLVNIYSITDNETHLYVVMECSRHCICKGPHPCKVVCCTD